MPKAKMPKVPPINSKPAMERKRRARINESMSQLKLLIVDDLVDQPGRLSKLDKAETLESTVRHFKKITGTQQNQGVSPDKAYQTGANDCLWSLYQMITLDEKMEADSRIKLLDHISSWLYHKFDVHTPVLDLSTGNAKGYGGDSLSENHHVLEGDNGVKIATEPMNVATNNATPTIRLGHLPVPKSDHSQLGNLRIKTSCNSSPINSYSMCDNTGLRRQKAPLKDISNTLYPPS